MLRAAGTAPVVRVSDVDEDAVAAALGADAHPEQVVAALAAAKAQAVRATVGDDPEIAADVVVIGCDSMLLVDDRLTGKPHTADVARAQWMSVRGRSAQLLTGHCVIRVTPGSPDGHAQAVSSTVVRFADVDEATIDAYVASGEPLEVAGGFTLDGLGGWLIEGIDGDPSSVIGIGLPLVRRLLAELDVHLSELWTH